MFTTSFHSLAYFVRPVAFPTPNHGDAVRSVIDTLEILNLKDGLAKFTSFRTRCEYCTARA